MLLKTIVKVDRVFDHKKKDGSIVTIYRVKDENGYYTTKPCKDVKDVVEGQKARAVFDFRTYFENQKVYEYLVLKSLEGIK